MFLPQNAHTQLNRLHATHPREREQQASYRVYSFGQFRLFTHEKAIKESMWRRSKAKTLLKWFVLNPDKLCSADQFIDLFWPDLPLDAAMGNLHVTIHFLRHLLEPSLGSRQESKFVRRQANNFYWFHMDETWWTDTSDVEQLFENAKVHDRHEDYSKALYYYRKIVSYCSLGFIPEDESEPWLQQYRQHYSYMYSQVLVRLIQIYQLRNELEEVLEYAYLALAANPYCEPAIRAIIDAHLKEGNTSMAMYKLENFHHALQRNLGMEPSKEMHALRQKIVLASK
jgi:DNA-binding SARP family transcriptional activator